MLLPLRETFGQSIVVILLCLKSISALQGQHGLVLHHQHDEPGLSFLDSWVSLGPFRIGTREASWGADPLEALGGFINLLPDNVTTFRSPLAVNASVQWQIRGFQAVSKSRTTSIVHIHLEHPEVDWAFAQRVYGWSALQYQTWTRGYIVNHGNHFQRALIHLDGILEFYLNDDVYFGGDFYGFDRAPILVDLKPGHNKLDIRLIRDVRVMSGNSPPVIDAILEVELVTDGLRVDVSKIIAPDLVGDQLPSFFINVPITNLHEKPVVLGFCRSTVSGSDLALFGSDLVHILPGQTRPVAFLFPEKIAGTNLHITICYHGALSHNQEDGIPLQKSFDFSLIARDLFEPHKFTFKHPSGIISYAVLKPPRTNLSSIESRPLLVMLHGAGLEADSDLVRHSLDEVPDLEAFALFPSGGSPWSADDWHVWGHADVCAAIDSVPHWMQRMNWSGPRATIDEVLFAGHSNGGQGAWYFASHLPDKTLAAAPISGWTSIENYVPYHFWTESDPLKASIASMSRIAFKNEMFIDNMAHVPTLNQHGALDDNVPAYHSRLMRSLHSFVSNNSVYVELPDKRHWFDGAVSTEPLRQLYRTYLSAESKRIPPTARFSLVSAATSEIGSKFGISIDQLISPDSLGRIDVDFDPKMAVRWVLRPSNVRRLSFDIRLLPGGGPCAVRFEPQGHILHVASHQVRVHFLQDENGQWIQQDLPSSFGERSGLQRGTLESILRTTAPFQIMVNDDASAVAVQISRNMLQYYGADSTIRPLRDWKDAIGAGGNVISVSFGAQASIPPSSLPNFPVSFQDHGVCLRTVLRQHCHLVPYADGLGVIFIRPLAGERLELVVWGHDQQGLEAAARLVPAVTGVGQPDFIVLSPKAKWQGLQGAQALGFFDYAWNISQASYLG